MEPYWALKSTLWGPCSLSLMQQNKHFQPHSGQRAVLMCSNALDCDFIAHTVLKYKNPQFYMGNTDLTRRSDWSGGALLGTKIHLVGPLLTQFNAQKQALPATRRPKGRSYVLQCLALRIHCTRYAQIMESLVFRL